MITVEQLKEAADASYRCAYDVMPAAIELRAAIMLGKMDKSSTRKANDAIESALSKLRERRDRWKRACSPELIRFIELSQSKRGRNLSVSPWDVEHTTYHWAAGANVCDVLSLADDARIQSNEGKTSFLDAFFDLLQKRRIGSDATLAGVYRELADATVDLQNTHDVGADWTPDDVEAEIMEVLAASPTRLTRELIATNSGHDPKKARPRIDSLIEHGFLREPPTGKGLMLTSRARAWLENARNSPE